MLFGSVLLMLLGVSQAYRPLAPVKRLASSKYAHADVEYDVQSDEDAKSPYVVIVNFNQDEREVVTKGTPVPLNYSVLVPGLSPLFPYVYCDKSYKICNVIAGENEVNAAASLSALLTSSKFNFTQTYFIVAGTGDIDPSAGPLGSVVFSKYTVSVDLQNEIWSQEIPEKWPVGLYSYGSKRPNTLPKSWVGTEVFEVNDALRQRFAKLAASAKLNTSTSGNFTGQLFNGTANASSLNASSSGVHSRKARYTPSVSSSVSSSKAWPSSGAWNATASAIANITGPTFLTNVSAAYKSPSILLCDSATSNVIFTGNVLADAVSNLTSIFTNGTANFCITSTEDAAVLEAAVRGAKFGLTDYSRWSLVRGGARFTRAPFSLANKTVKFATSNLTDATVLARENVYAAVLNIVEDVYKNWNRTYANGTSAKNYVGDVLGSLGGTPDFGPGKGYNFTKVY